MSVLLNQVTIITSAVISHRRLSYIIWCSAFDASAILALTALAAHRHSITQKAKQALPALLYVLKLLVWCEHAGRGGPSIYDLKQHVLCLSYWHRWSWWMLIRS